MSNPEDHPKPTPASDESFLQRWARRKEAARAGKSPENEGGPTAAAPAPTAGRLNSEGVEAPGAAPAAPELPPLESLTEESDFSAFMHAGVSADLQRQALRKLFRGAKYATIDPLDPFRADFTEYLPLGDIVTADMKFHAERLLREQLEAVAGQSESPADAPTGPAEAKGQETEQSEDENDERRDA